MSHTLNVFYEDLKVGVFERDDNLVHSFTYDPSWLKSSKKFPLSLSMPLQEGAFSNKTTLSFFENLLPEGEVRKGLGTQHQIESPYEFLKEFGADCAGAITLTEKSTSPFQNATPDLTEIPLEEIYKAIDNKQSVAELIAEKNPGYLSLAGAQDKFPAIFKEGKLFLPTHGAPTTHIVKVPIQHSGIKESVYNEYYCMQLAQTIGLNIPYNQVLDEGAHPLFIIDRYDRITKNGQTSRLHQQDFCQAQGVVSENKYESKNGPNLQDNYQLIVKNVTIAKRNQNIYQFFDWICFNLLIGNNDSHSKNISLLLKNNKLELAPFYDLLCSHIYEKLKKKFAFFIGDRNDASKIGKNQFEALEDQLNVKRGTLITRLHRVRKLLLNHKDSVAKKIANELPNSKIHLRISDLIEKKCKGLSQQGL